MPASFSMNASHAEPCLNQNKAIAAFFALTVLLNARQSNNINLVVLDRIRKAFRFVALAKFDLGGLLWNPLPVGLPSWHRKIKIRPAQWYQGYGKRLRFVMTISATCCVEWKRKLIQ
jgi:hypothetical protein